MAPPTLHVTDLVPGAQLKVALRAGHAVEINPASGVGQTPTKPRRAFGYSRTTFYAYLVANNPQTGSMTINYNDTINPEKPYTAVIGYSDILFLFQVVAQRPVVETAPAKFPGFQALGTKMQQLFPQPNLIPVSFLGRTP